MRRQVITARRRWPAGPNERQTAPSADAPLDLGRRSIMEWAVDRGYFASSEPVGDPRRRRKIAKRRAGVPGS